MAINLSGQAIQDVRVAGVQAQRVMLGTGTSAVEVWSASVYPLTGTWGPLNLNEVGWGTRASHTITESGTFTITHTATMSYGQYVGIRTPAGTVTGNTVHVNGGTSTATTTVTLSAGSVVQFQTNSAYGTISGTWSIVKEASAVVTITASPTIEWQARDQFRAALAAHGTTHQTVTEIPFNINLAGSGSIRDLFADCFALHTAPAMDTTRVNVFQGMFSDSYTLTSVPAYSLASATSTHTMFRGCETLASLPDMDMSGVTNARFMFENTVSLTDGSVRLFNRNPGVDSTGMISGSALTREPWSVTITGTSGFTSRDQFRAACTQYGVDYQTVTTLPFRLDTSQATNMSSMFNGCSSLTTVPDLNTSQATNLSYMFNNCSSLTDGNVRCIGRHPNAITNNMITGSGLTRLPFYDTNGNPI